MLMADDDLLLFENGDWTVTSAGLEHRGNGYFIARDELAAKRTDGLWAWPVHMAEKLWCAPRPFAEAFMAAVRAYDLAADASLALSFLDAGRLESERLVAAAAAQRAARGRDEAVDLSAPAAGVPLPRLDSARGLRASRQPTWRRGRTARAGLRLLDWLRGARNRR